MKCWTLICFHCPHMYLVLTCQDGKKKKTLCAIRSGGIRPRGIRSGGIRLHGIRPGGIRLGGRGRPESCRAALANTKWDGRLALPCPGHTPHLLLYLHPITVHFVKYNDQSVLCLLYKKRSWVSPSPQGEGPVHVNKVRFKSAV